MNPAKERGDMYGWMGKILRVDLTNGRITRESLDEAQAQAYVGGRGFTIRHLYDAIEPGTDPLGEGNPLIFAHGPACGTLVPGSQRWTVGAKSPLTGLVGDANCGGSFGIGLKYAGYDMLIVEGQSERPTYLLIDDDQVQLRDADHLWGKTTVQTERQIKGEVGDSGLHIATTGTAGDNLVKFATINNDNRTAGRTGMGTVMGAKRLKAVAVRGNNGVKVSNPEWVEQISKEVYRSWRENTDGLKALQEYGAGVASGISYNRLGIIQGKNYREGFYKEYNAVADRLKDELWLKPRACFSCPVACGHVYIVSQGPYAGTFGDGLYGASLWYTARLGNPDPELMCKLTALSNEYGIDEGDLSGVLAWLMECYQEGVITAKDLDGIEMDWGNPEAMLKITEMIAHRRGIGEIFAEGAKRASGVIGKGSDRYVMHVKGMDLDSRDPRGSKSWGFGFAVGSRGADHCRHLIPDLSEGFDRLEERGKGRLHKWYEDARAFQHALENCIFLWDPRDAERTQLLADMYCAVTGNEMRADDVMATGERITNLERAFNIREGLTRKDDTLPRRFLEEPIKEGPSKGQVVDLDLMLDEYYEARGWDLESGFPTRDKLEELGLKAVADELEGAGLLGQ
jgi:aldehyde:ferredoxin oxidoreductase